MGHDRIKACRVSIDQAVANYRSPAVHSLEGRCKGTPPLTPAGSIRADRSSSLRKAPGDTLSRSYALLFVPCIPPCMTTKPPTLRRASCTSENDTANIVGGFKSPLTPQELSGPSRLLGVTSAAMRNWNPKFPFLSDFKRAIIDSRFARFCAGTASPKKCCTN